MKKLFIITLLSVSSICAQESKEDLPVLFAKYQHLPIKIRREIADFAGLNEPINKPYDWNYLQKATTLNNFDDVQLLVTCGADIDRTINKKYQLSLSRAAHKPYYTHTPQARRQFNILCYLILHKADLNLQDENGKTALHHAAMSIYKPAIEALLANKANPHIIDTDGNTALDILHKGVLDHTCPLRRRRECFTAATIFAQYQITSKIALEPMPSNDTIQKNFNINHTHDIAEDNWNLTFSGFGV